MKNTIIFILIVAVGYGIGTFGKSMYYDMTTEDGYEEVPLEKLLGAKTKMTQDEKIKYSTYQDEAAEAKRKNDITGQFTAFKKMMKIDPWNANNYIFYANLGLDVLAFSHKAYLNGQTTEIPIERQLEDLRYAVDVAYRLDPKNESVLDAKIKFNALFASMIGFGKDNFERHINRAHKYLDEVETIVGKKQSQYIAIRAKLFELNKQSDEALAKIEEGLKLENAAKGIYTLYDLKVKILASQSKFDEVAKLYEVLLSSDTIEPTLKAMFLEHRADYYIVRNMLYLAKEDLVTLLDMSPNNPALKAKIAKLEEEIQKIESAAIKSEEKKTEDKKTPEDPEDS